jgi:hypothetical protein
MRQIILSYRCATVFLIRGVGSVIVLAVALSSCSSAEAPLAIRMYNPKTNQTLHCTARSESSTDSPVLASVVEACARQLEARGFVRDN